MPFQNGLHPQVVLFARQFSGTRRVGNDSEPWLLVDESRNGLNPYRTEGAFRALMLA